ncbi:MAG: hypothetical protein HOK63_07585 [Thaumarchaeota archaeon]|jgi:hypothetical protein|nr:hypothetical protein [Nitrososphaerota archaeon]MBT5842083.1 hypothetical protein [Nitrososphaerota archaeon]MBT6469482.1 hypothetical protein [Nitrososphaerota archaeon]
MNFNNLKIILFLLPFVFLINFAYADNTQIQMDWLVEGQIDDQNVTQKEAEIVSSYEELVSENQKPIYDKFITNNQYSIGDYKITIDSEEGQMLNGVLIEQRDTRQDSFQHKIKYYDRFSDGYVQIAEALLDPIGNSKYLIKGQSLDYNPNSNLELFVLERGYNMDNLEAIPNDIFTPKEFTLGRALMDEATRSGEGEFDLREYSPNYLLLNKEQIQERMINSFSEQTSQLFDGIMSGEKSPSSIGIAISQPTGESENIFDNFKFEKPKFENTRHIRDSLQSNPLNEILSIQNFENISLLLMIPVFLALVIFGYLMRKKQLTRKSQEPILQISKPQIDFRELTQELLDKSQSLYANNKRKEAFEILSQAIRYYYSQNMEIYKEMTTLELLNILRNSKSDSYNQVKGWLLLCGSVEYAKYVSNDDDYENIILKFSKEVFK